jgi:hypothetical protein
VIVLALVVIGSLVGGRMFRRSRKR